MSTRSPQRRLENRELLRFVRGELSADETRHLEKRLESDGELRRRHEDLRDSWNVLELPPAPPLTGGFRDGVVEAVRRLGTDELRWSLAPRWARAGTALALVAGMAVGFGMGHRAVPVSEDLAAGGPVLVSETELEYSFAAELDAGPISLAEAYWLGLESAGESLLDESDDGERL